MKILNPNNTTHTITLLPRFSPLNPLILELTNKVSKVVSVVGNTFIYERGVLNIAFDFTVLESEQYLIEITDDSVVIFVDNIFCTAQDPQNYKLTKDKIIYV